MSLSISREYFVQQFIDRDFLYYSTMLRFGKSNKEDLANALLKGLNTMRMQGDMCDVTLRVGEKAIRAHKNVLCACSPYFMAMFSGRFTESRSSEVSLEEIDGDCLELLIEYMYTGELPLDSIDVRDILLTAAFLQITSAEELCYSNILNKIDLENYIENILFGGKNSIKRLLDIAIEIAVSNFSEIFVKDDYLTIEFEEFKELITKLKKKDGLQYPEDMIYSFIARWIQHSYDDRKKFIDDLLRLLNPSLISPNVLHSPEIANIKSSVPSEWETYENAEPHDHVLVSRRIGHFLPLRIALFSEAKHRQIKSLPENISDGCYTCNGFYIYHQGGWKNCKKVLTESYVYHPISCTWVPFVPLQVPRAYHRGCVLNGKIYSVGGTDGDRALKSVEFIDPVTCQRAFTVPLPRGKERPAVGVREDSMYVIGGSDRGSCFKCVHRFDAREGKWQELAPSPFRAGASTCGIVGDFIYTTHPDTLQRYDIRANNWSLISAQYKRYPPEIFAMGDELYGLFTDHIGKFVLEESAWSCQRVLKCNLPYLQISPNLQFPKVDGVTIADPEYEGDYEDDDNRFSDYDSD